MSIIKFDRYRFDPDRLELYVNDTRLALRPKTASVLAVLIRERTGVVSKREIFAQVWRSRHVQDQSLFQAVSELRRLFAPLDPIKTHPNLGYQWVAPVSGSTHRRLAFAAMAASIAVAFTAALFFAAPGAIKSDHSSAVVSVDRPLNLSPALEAFAVGLSHLSARRLIDAERFFALAVQENPDFLEAHLMLSEALLAQGLVDRARAQALALLGRDQATGDAYVVVAAMELLSRTDQQRGHSVSAVDWARAAADSARLQGFACAAADIEDRLAKLLGDGNDVTVPQQSSIIVAALAKPTLPDYCKRIRTESPELGDLNDVSHCRDTRRLAMQRRERSEVGVV